MFGCKLFIDFCRTRSNNKNSKCKQFKMLQCRLVLSRLIYSKPAVDLTCFNAEPFFFIIIHSSTKNTGHRIELNLKNMIERLIRLTR